MRRLGCGLGSLAVHAGIAGILFVVVPARRPGPARTVTIEVIAAPQSIPPAAPDREARRATPGGGAAPRQPPRARRPVRAAPPAPRATPAQVAAPPAPSPSAGAAPAAASAAAIEAASPGGDAEGEGRGGGEGGGSGRGRGAGTGPGAASEPPIRAFERMVAAPRSKARPARLVYPKREREETPEKLFVARLTVDADGVVVGAKLQHAPSGLAADRAMSAVFRFAYDPALDDAGRPITSVVEQRFMVE